jgi:hypothetical protein
MIILWAVVLFYAPGILILLIFPEKQTQFTESPLAMLFTVMCGLCGLVLGIFGRLPGTRRKTK